ncbi:acetylornithine transaminase [Kocuria rhizophila]|uniref:acetylornithine transaminase n=1 Tax=Kocuria TaxID=57493 RepID=UPI0002E63E52|nr:MULTISPECIES: acetylornithine transaminase [Kocuria]MXN62641.1 acetylornithine transaminase [Bacillus sp. BGMRC0062]WIW68286.1 acetylornithine transaminase [Kocuria sp. ChxB]KUP28495.1 acetylornithine aminotransferase [Kocuria rhizophila]MBO4145390.1 acetylornithine transaminase [Kocuria rhizophila]MCT1545636.1 acetylornithine transaminase [Kocuria rhizophila]
MSRTTELLDGYRDNLLGVFGDPALVLVEGQGCRVTDADGRRYLDLLAGIAVNSLGHAHPAWVRAVAEQAGRLAHVSNLFTTPEVVELARELLEVTDAPSGSHVFFANSGSEANEAAFKLARRHGREHPDAQGRPRTRVLALEHAFHGRTMGSLALTAKEAYRAPFEPLPGGVSHVPATVEALAAELDDTVAALIVEPVQGEAGVRGLPEGYLARARELTREHGALLIVDEVQSGIGRTGDWLASTAQLPGGEFPDAVTLAKGLGGGFPIGALLTAGPEVSGLLGAGQHGTTFGGNPLAAAAALATVRTIRDEGLLENARAVGEHLAARLRDVPGVTVVRGHGLLVGLDLVQGAPDDAVAPRLVAAARDAGFLVNATGPATVRLAPPLIVTRQEVDTFVSALPDLLRTVSST